VPIQAVAPSEGKQVCYVVNGLKSDKREVEIGQFNDEFIEIRKGLKEGERVLLRPPESGMPETDEQQKQPDNTGKAPAEEKPAPQKTEAPPARTG